MIPALKICGMCDPENIREVSALAPDYMGFIFYPPSARFIGERIYDLPPTPGIRRVGVFVNESIANILRMKEICSLDLIQLHGNESPDFCISLRKFAPVIKAIGVDSPNEIKDLHPYADTVDYFLFDKKSAQYGGTGISFDHDLLSYYDLATPYFLSGGLGVPEVQFYQRENADTRLFGLDLNSKFESAPGEKDIELLKSVMS